MARQRETKPSIAAMFPAEAAIVRAKEKPATKPEEAAVTGPQETAPVRVCGIEGCTTWYDDPVVMERHRRRQHGIGGENLNKPKPRNPAVNFF